MADVIINRNPGFNKIIAFDGQTDFDFTFPIFSKEHLVVIKNTYTMLTLDTDYAIITPVQQQSGGTMRLNVPASAKDIITLVLSPPVERTTDFQPGGDFIAGVLNTQLDLITQMIQANERDIRRSVKADFAENPDLLVEQLFEAAEETVQFAKSAEAAKTETLAAAASAVASAGSAASSALNAADNAASAAIAANTATTKAAEAVTAADSALDSAATALSSATTASGAAQTATAAATSATQNAATALNAASAASSDAASAAQSAQEAAQFEILPATATRLGVVKIGDGLDVNAEGVLSAVGGETVLFQKTVKLEIIDGVCTINLQADTPVYVLEPTQNVSIVINTGEIEIPDGKWCTFELGLNMYTVRAITFPSNVLWLNNETPDLSQAGYHMLAFRAVGGGAYWVGNSQGWVV